VMQATMKPPTEAAYRFSKVTVPLITAIVRCWASHTSVDTWVFAA
jgi:hypothetical protein